MTKQETYAFLTAQGIAYEVTEHKAVFKMGEVPDVPLPYPEADAKNLFVRDDKKRKYYLITVRGDKRVDLKEFRRLHGTRSLTFASAEELWAFMKLLPGSVTPLGLLEDTEHRIEFYLDKDFFKDRGLIGCHPNENTATVWMKAEDLIRLLEAHGTPVQLTEL